MSILEVNLETKSNHMVVYTGLVLAFNNLGVILCRVAGCIVAYEQLVLSVCITVVVVVLIVDNYLHVVVNLPVKTYGISLG